MNRVAIKVTTLRVNYSLFLLVNYEKFIITYSKFGQAVLLSCFAYLSFQQFGVKTIKYLPVRFIRLPAVSRLVMLSNLCLIALFGIHEQLDLGKDSYKFSVGILAKLCIFDKNVCKLRNEHCSL